MTLRAFLLLCLLLSPIVRVSALEQAETETPKKKIEFGGKLQLKAHYRNVLEGDKTEEVDYYLRRATLDLRGLPLPGLGFELSLHYDTWQGFFGLDEAYIHWTPDPLFGVKAGQYRKPVSQEELTPTSSLLTAEKSLLYNDSLKRNNGYIGFDLGFGFTGSWKEGLLTYELGFFRGLDRKNGYFNLRSEEVEKGIGAPDLALRLTSAPYAWLFLEAAVSTKTVEDASSNVLGLAYNNAYQCGLRLTRGGAALQAEAALGDSHRGSDVYILDGSSIFFAFYLMPSYRLELVQDHSLELAAAWEGLDPAISSSLLDANDSFLRYYLGINYFYKHFAGLQLGYSILHPITLVEQDRELSHAIEVMARLSW